MKSKAILMALAMMTTALAGCTSGTDGVPEVDEDALNELIQNNLQDFINNTTVIVNQDFQYHNNTTTNYQVGGGGATNDSAISGQVLFIVDYEFTVEWSDVQNMSEGYYLLYEIGIPDGMALSCHNDNVYPRIYRFNPDSDNVYWNTWGSAMPVLDGFEYHCENGPRGGVGQQTLHLYINNQHLSNYYFDMNGSIHHYEDNAVVEARLLYSYILTPVIADTDGGVE